MKDCSNITFGHLSLIAFQLQSGSYTINKHLYKVLNFLNNPFPDIALNKLIHKTLIQNDPYHNLSSKISHISFIKEHYKPCSFFFYDLTHKGNVF